ncbi:MAG TPA: hypothetical protein VF763_06995 [Candidatus Limnocylindrales bacterium]
MVALVLVGHSAELLRGLTAMLAQLAPSVPVRAAGGTPDGNLGTSAPLIERALWDAAAISGGDGAVVLLDLGSAFLSYEIALENLPAQMAARIRLSHGPLVEGAVLGALEASGGAGLERVLEVADAAAAAPKILEP